MEKQLLSEVSRVREIMGLEVIIEQEENKGGRVYKDS